VDVGCPHLNAGKEGNKPPLKKLGDLSKCPHMIQKDLDVKDCPFLSKAKDGEHPEVDAESQKKCPYLNKMKDGQTTGACPYLNKDEVKHSEL
jgi:hypothetical protein